MLLARYWRLSAKGPVDGGLAVGDEWSPSADALGRSTKSIWRFALSYLRPLLRVFARVFLSCLVIYLSLAMFVFLYMSSQYGNQLPGNAWPQMILIELVVALPACIAVGLSVALVLGAFGSTLRNKPFSMFAGGAAAIVAVVVVDAGPGLSSALPLVFGAALSNTISNTSNPLLLDPIFDYAKYAAFALVVGYSAFSSVSFCEEFARPLNLNEQQ